MEYVVNGKRKSNTKVYLDPKFPFNDGIPLKWRRMGRVKEGNE